MKAINPISKCLIHSVQQLLKEKISYYKISFASFLNDLKSKPK